MHDDIIQAYQKNDLSSLQIGGILLDDKLLSHAPVHLILKSFNRHGLIAGATGSGKTKTMQVLCEQLSLAGVPSLVMDIKGDISGLAMSGEVSDSLKQRSSSLDLSYTPHGFPVEFLTLNANAPGIPLRAALIDFGPLLFSRMLELNDTQSGVLTIVFEYAKDVEIPLVNLEDLKALLQFMQSDAGNAEVTAKYGSVASSSIGSIMRNIIELESQGGGDFFGEPAFKVEDLLHLDDKGAGVISILRLMDIQDRPALFSTFMVKLLTDIYHQFPELGDPAKPKLVLFIDEAHLIFNNANKSLLNLLTTMVKLIRSKGVGLIFCTQTPNDIPEGVLSQLGLKIQHALRAFTAKDRQAMKLVAQNFPLSTYYNTEHILTNLGIGEALLTALDAQGQPTPLIECLMRPPESRMGTVSDEELKQLVSASRLYSHYKQKVEETSASEILDRRKKITMSMDTPNQTDAKKAPKEGPSVFEQISKNTLARQVVRDSFRWLLKTITKSLKK